MEEPHVRGRHVEWTGFSDLQCKYEFKCSAEGRLTTSSGPQANSSINYCLLISVAYTYGSHRSSLSLNNALHRLRKPKAGGEVGGVPNPYPTTVISWSHNLQKKYACRYTRVIYTKTVAFTWRCALTVDYTALHYIAVLHMWCTDSVCTYVHTLHYLTLPYHTIP